MKEDVDSVVWWMTSIYGWLEGNIKFKIWEMIRFLGIYSEDLWIIVGDYNKVF